jgi:Fur family ferric uptake transcriptional regulator
LLLKWSCIQGTFEREDPVAKKTSAAAVSSHFDELLRSHGLRRTTARVRVLRFVQASMRPLSHGEVAKALAAESFDYATVYRNLTDLAEVGILVRTDLGDHVWRFELASERADAAAQHPHFICTDCGAVSCLPDGTVKLTPRGKTPRAVTRRQVTVQLRGRCDDCA